MVEDTVTTEETDELSDEIEVSPSHPYDCQVSGLY